MKSHCLRYYEEHSHGGAHR